MLLPVLKKNLELWIYEAHTIPGCLNHQSVQRVLNHLRIVAHQGDITGILEVKCFLGQVHLRRPLDQTKPSVWHNLRQRWKETGIQRLCCAPLKNGEEWWKLVISPNPPWRMTVQICRDRYTPPGYSIPQQAVKQCRIINGVEGYANV